MMISFSLAVRQAPSPQPDPETDIPLHGPDGFEGMRRAGRLAALTLDFITPHVRPGVTTAALNQLVESFMRDHGAVPATLGYKGYAHASCISVNHVVCHGIPGDKRLAEGDIVNIDVTPVLDGWYGDSSRMYYAGTPPLRARRLVEVTYDAMMLGINMLRPGIHLSDMGAAIERFAREHRYSSVADFCGHGLGRVFHAPPSVVHTGPPGQGPILRPGMFFTVEPMINAGRPDVKILADQWTAVTKDKSLSAQFEHSVGITETGVEIFTLSPAGHTKPPYTV